MIRVKAPAALAAAALAGLFCAADAKAQWTVTVYKTKGGPDITSMTLADQYFDGQRATRFVANGTVAQVDLFENGGAGQFTINNPFPGVDQNEAVGDTRDFTARITGTLDVQVATSYDFFTDSDDGNRFRLDLNQNGTFEANESILPDGGLQGAGTPERSGQIPLALGQYKYEVSFFERGGGGSIDAGYRSSLDAFATQFVIGDGAGGIATTADASVRVVGAALGAAPEITNFAGADALRANAGANDIGFPVTETRAVFNMTDSGAQGDFTGDTGYPGLGAPDANDDQDFAAYGRGTLVVPAGGLLGVVFRSNTDDGGRLLIDLSGDGDFDDAGEIIINDDVLSGPHNFDSAATNLPAGNYLIEYGFFERGGGAESEVSANTGAGFRLLGDVAGGGLQIAPVPEPSALALLGLGAVAMIRRRRK